MKNAEIERLLALLPNACDAAIAVKDPEGRYLYANPAFGRYMGRPPGDVIGCRDAELLDDERATTLHVVDQSVFSRQGGIGNEEHFSRDGGVFSYVTTRFPIFDEDRRLIALGIIAMETTDQRRGKSQAEQALESAERDNAQLRSALQSMEELASTDRLTTAWNRKRFGEEVEVEIHRSSRYGHPVSLLLFDIDHFKQINDTYGHQRGDQVLVAVTSLVREVIRKPDSLTRWGGEEFVVLMPNTGLSHARLLAERIRAHVAAKDIAGLKGITVSIGVAEYLPTDSPSEWLERADRAMYRAKHNGRNRVEFDNARRDMVLAEHMESGFVKLIWKDAFRSGHPLIDEQHQELFQITNELLEAMLSGYPAEEIAIIVGNLLTGVAHHFEEEERILAELAYPELRAHAAEHRKLLTKGHELAQAFRDGTLSLGQLFQFLAYDVVTRHMLGADRDYFPLISS
jgi:diguanylate cyclase (GGDEF)-like protein/hemerythrin-like metal-binding protein/PAS domain S-box-containing protein